MSCSSLGASGHRNHRSRSGTSPTCLPRPGQRQPWPDWADGDVVRAFTRARCRALWTHPARRRRTRPPAQARGDRHRHGVGQVAGLSTADLPTRWSRDPARACTWSPTKALGHDQLFRARTDGGGDPGAGTSRRRPPRTTATHSAEIRRFARERSRWVFSNPDMIHLSPGQPRPVGGVPARAALSGCRRMSLLPRNFSARTWRWCCAGLLRPGRATPDATIPTVILASATTAALGRTAAELIGQHVEEITADGAPQGARTIALWGTSRCTDITGRTVPGPAFAGSEAARVMADLDRRGRPDADLRPWPRRGAELTALVPAPAWPRSPRTGRPGCRRTGPGYLAEDRRALEAGTCRRWSARSGDHECPRAGHRHRRTGRRGLGRVPGSVSSFWQQGAGPWASRPGCAGGTDRAGRPLDTYRCTTRRPLLDEPVERVVIDPANPYVMGRPTPLCRNRITDRGSRDRTVVGPRSGGVADRRRPAA